MRFDPLDVAEQITIAKFCLILKGIKGSISQVVQWKTPSVFLYSSALPSAFALCADNDISTRKSTMARRTGRLDLDIYRCSHHEYTSTSCVSNAAPLLTNVLQFAMPLKISLILVSQAVCAFLVNLTNAASDPVDCQLKENGLKSPGWPNSYPNSIHNWSYSVSIPPAMDMIVFFDFFELEDGELCPYDFLDISGDFSQFMRVCGNHSDETVRVQGYYVNLNFHSDSSVARRGFDLFFVPVDRLSGSVARKKITYLKKKLSYINSDDEAQYRRIKDAVQAFKETRLIKEKNHERTESESLDRRTRRLK
ncbi:uncharacterized protein [Montipora capricornis]|uniref:uncharacterized protein isoform X2 n=1 Tax=Montipora capricornis TaxID=246305 RepID=UPI0035F11F51